MKITFRGFASSAVLLLGWSGLPAHAQVAFQPQGCEFRAIFVTAPDVKTATVPDEAGHPQTETIASLAAMVDGSPNFVRAECMNAEVPATIDEKLLLEDMQTVASGNNLRNPVVWIEKSTSGDLVGRIRGSMADTVATYQLEIRTAISDATTFSTSGLVSPPGVFPSEGNLIFLKELRRDGRPLN